MTYPGPPLAGNEAFRILQLQPGNAGDPIRCTLEIAAIADPESRTEYEALSYAWEDTTLTHEVQYGDPSASEPASLEITTSCHNALERLRLPNRTRAIWVDAVCIDQSNLIERSTQIGLMRTIYSNARQVIVYLGSSHDESDSVMRYLQDLHEPIEYPRETITVLPPSEEAWKSFFARPWFSRTWVLQEILNGQSVEIYCGDVSLPWGALEDYARQRTGASHPYQLSVATVEFAKLYRSRHKKRLLDQVTPGVNLFNTLQTTRGCLSTDPRDKLYGILPLLHASDAEGLSQPDYHKSPEEVFTNLALYLYENVGPQVLREGSTIHNKGRLLTLPSWVPDWTRIEATRLHEYTSNYGGMKPPAAGGEISGSKKPRGIPSADGQIVQHLGITGLRIGSPVKMSDECDVQKNTFPFEQWKITAKAATLYRNKSTAPPPAPLPFFLRSDELSSWALAFFQTITHGEVIYPKAIRRAAKLMISWEKDSSSTVSLKDIFKGFPPSYRRQVERLLACCDQRKFAILDNGMMALVPTHTEFDDVVYVVPGAAVPFVLRKSGEHFVLIGECYVQGIMYGEARGEDDDISMEELVLE